MHIKRKLIRRWLMWGDWVRWVYMPWSQLPMVPPWLASPGAAPQLLGYLWSLQLGSKPDSGMTVPQQQHNPQPKVESLSPVRLPPLWFQDTSLRTTAAKPLHFGNSCIEHLPSRWLVCIAPTVWWDGHLAIYIYILLLN
uniref:Uncharacterized protein n=1 Tax=Pipistrellus kuhlii TaxID=59472 RepID=A0A7J7T0C1_PIPKU|nr:hypothetical protein mPipKuh1_009750 [Pipistrellus kuhlii]